MKIGAVFKNTALQSLTKIITLTLSLLLITPLLTRYLAEDGYGGYAFVTAFVLFFGTVANWGTDIITVREAVKSKRQQVVFGTAAILRLAFSVVAFVLINIAVRTNPSWTHLVGPTTIASFVLLFLSIKTTVGAVFQALLRYDLLAAVELVSTAAFLIFIVMAMAGRTGVGGVMLAWVVATGIAAAVGVVLAARVVRLNLSFDRKVGKRIFLEAVPTGALLATFTVYNRLDTVILQHFHTDAAVGVYGLAYKVYDNATAPAAFLANSLFPIFSRGFAGRDSQLKYIYKRAIFWFLFFGVAAAGSVFVLAGPIVWLLGAGGFAQAAGILRILSVALVFAYLNHLTGYSLIAFGRQSSSFLIAIAALVFNIAANIIFIPVYSYTAAAAVTVATEGIVLVLSSIMVWRILIKQ